MLRKSSVNISLSKNTSSATQLVKQLRSELSSIKGFGYLTVDNILQLSSVCGILPAYAYTIKDLPNAVSSGSNKFITNELTLKQASYTTKNG